MLEIRPATSSDEAAIKDLISASEPVDRAARVGPDGVVDWREPELWPDVAVANEQGATVGFAQLLWPTARGARGAEILVHPEWRGRGIGRKLADWALARAASLGIRLMGSYHSESPGAPHLIAALRGTEIGRWHEMVADPLPDFAPLPLPAGYTLRHAVAGRDEATFAEIFSDSFSEHRFLVPPTVEGIRRRWDNPRFDGERFAFAESGGTVVAVSAIRQVPVYRGDTLISAGHIGPVGVSAGHRSRGLARALMINNLNYAARHGWQASSLSVDEINTNAQALYASLGFRTVHDWVWWQVRHDH